MHSPDSSLLNDNSITRLIQIALNEDIGLGDLTTELTISPSQLATANFLCKAEGIISGLHIAEQVFHILGEDVHWQSACADGTAVHKGFVAAQVQGPAHLLLSGERTALNFLQRMSGVATKAHSFAQAVAHTSTRILDTRKTIPGWRRLDKYASQCGGAVNHRMGLFDMIMIKDNHVAAAGGIAEALQAVRSTFEEGLIKIELECDSLEQLELALSIGGFHRVMFDNFSLDDTRRGVEMVNKRFETEASGGITLDTVAAIAECGVDYISTGAITHSAVALDISMDIQLHL